MANIRFLGTAENIDEVDTNSMEPGDLIFDRQGRSWVFNGEQMVLVQNSSSPEVVQTSESFSPISGQLYSPLSHLQLSRIPLSGYPIEIYRSGCFVLQPHEFVFHRETNSIEMLHYFHPGEQFEVHYWTESGSRYFVPEPMYSPPKKKMKKVKGIVL